MNAHLRPGERVLWQGRVAVGAPWPALPRIVLGALGCWSALIATVLLPALLLWARGAGDPVTWIDLGGWAGFVGGLVGWGAGTIALSKLIGPSYLSLLWLLLTTPCLMSGWLADVQAHGWLGALARQDVGFVMTSLVWVGVPAGITVLTVLDRLQTTCVVTDRRLILVNGAGRIVRECSYRHGANDDLRVERTWRAPGGLLCAGLPWEPHVMALALRDDDPVEVLAQVRRAR